MKKIKVTRTEATILDAIKTVKNKGISIKEGGWFVEWNSNRERWEPEARSTGHCSCPLGAVLLALQPKPSEDQLQWLSDGADTDMLADIAAKTLGKDREWVDNFIGNFDEESATEGKGSNSGAKLRKLFVK
jgi:hypothetical protein